MSYLQEGKDRAILKALNKMEKKNNEEDFNFSKSKSKTKEKINNLGYHRIHSTKVLRDINGKIEPRKIKRIDIANMKTLSEQELKKLDHVRHRPINCAKNEVMHPYLSKCIKIDKFFQLIDNKIAESKIDPAIMRMPCPAGKVRNPYTGNCIKIETYNTMFPYKKIIINNKVKLGVNPKLLAYEKRLERQKEKERIEGLNDNQASFVKEILLRL